MGLTRSWLLERLLEAQSRPPRVRGDHDLNPDRLWPRAEKLIPAAVLVPVVDRGDDLALLFTQRTAHLADHAGQISFPGGRVDVADSDPVATALRETHEEIGLAPEHVQVVGRLDTYESGSGFRIEPVIGVIAAPYLLAPDPTEVADVFEVPLAFILDEANYRRGERELKGRTRYFHAFPFGERYIWGVTAGMLMNLVDVLREER